MAIDKRTFQKKLIPPGERIENIEQYILANSEEFDPHIWEKKSRVLDRLNNIELYLAATFEAYIPRIWEKSSRILDRLDYIEGFLFDNEFLPTDISWENSTDADIVLALSAAHNGIIDLQTDLGWEVGDTRTITISGDGFTEEDLDIVITSFDDYMNTGNVAQFDFKNSLTDAVKMNTGNTNVGGYGASLIKTTTIPSLINALPEWLQNILIEFPVLSSAGNMSSSIDTILGNKLSLRSVIEVTGSNDISFPGEGSQLSYYQTAEHRKKKAGSNGSFSYWWTRSPDKSSTVRFCAINAVGSGEVQNTKERRGLAPFGLL